MGVKGSFHQLLHRKNTQYCVLEMFVSTYFKLTFHGDRENCAKQLRTRVSNQILSEQNETLVSQ